MTRNGIRVGVIGAGRMGERHCRVYSTLPGVDFVGVCDASKPRGQTVARTYGVLIFEDYHELLANVDAVTVATSTPSHFAVAADCLSRGVHVLLEKPMAATLEEAAELVRLADSGGALLQVGHIERFNPAFTELENVVKDLEVLALNARRLSPFDTSNTEIDVVLDLMIHDIDLALALFGSTGFTLRASGRSARTDAVDYVAASIDFAGSAVATLTSSRITEQKVRALEVTALGAFIEVDLLNKSLSIHRRMVPEYMANHSRPLRYRQENVVEKIFIPTAEPLYLELEHFVNCVRTGAIPRVTGTDGLRALQVALAIKTELAARTAQGSAAEAGAKQPSVSLPAVATTAVG